MKGKTNLNWVLGLMAIAIILIAYGMYYQPAPEAVTVTPEGVPISPGVCDLDTTQNTQVHPINFATDASIAGVTDLYRVEGDTYTVVATNLAANTDQATVPMTSYKAYTDLSGYFSRWWDFETNCVAQHDETVKLAAVDGSVTINAIDSRNGNVNADTTNELDFTAGSSRNLKLSIQGGTARAYLADPKYDRIVVSLALVTASDIDYTETTLSGCERTSVPVALAGTDHIAWSCENTNVYNFGINEEHTLHIQCAAAANPADGEDITLTISPAGDVQHSITGKMLTNVVEDDAGTPIQTATTVTLYV